MCSYCGCESEPLITSLMDDHAVIANFAYRAIQALDFEDTAAIRSLMAELADRFRTHSLKEEAGLFAELAAAGEASDEVAQLLADHRRLRPLLAFPGLSEQPEVIRVALGDLERHAQTEDNDLFPYALQVLPARSWNHINASAEPQPTSTG